MLFRSVEAEKALRLAPDFVIGPQTRGWIYREQGKYAAALAQFEITYKSLPDHARLLGDLGHIYAVVGRTNDARLILAKLEQMAADGKDVTTAVAMVHLGLGDWDQTFAWIERATVNRSVDPRTLRFDAPYKTLIQDPRYPALLKKFSLNK